MPLFVPHADFAGAFNQLELLRIRSGAKASKAAGRIASEGVIGAWLAPDEKTAALVEINCETDFVAKNEDFAAFVDSVQFDKWHSSRELLCGPGLRERLRLRKMVRDRGFEPLTPSVSRKCSPPELSARAMGLYGTCSVLEAGTGIEPARPVSRDKGF